MELNDKIIVITGAASRIGRVMALRFAVEKPQKIIFADIDPIGAQATACDVGVVAICSTPLRLQAC